MVDYRALYQSSLLENGRHRSRISHLEERQQRVFECSFRNFRKLHEELSLVQREAEERNNKIQSFLASFLPEFRSQQQSDSKEPNSFEAPSRSPSAVQPSLPPKAHQSLPVLPSVEYQWDDIHCPNSRFHLSSSRLDELKLCLKFSVNSSHELPSKIQLEIKDSNGKVVYKKRQNIYYIKVQERIPTLDAEQDYRLEVTTVTEEKKESVKQVMIYNKHHVAKDSVVTVLSNAIQELVQEVRFYEAKPLSSPEFVQPQVVDQHHHPLEVKRVVVLKRPAACSSSPVIVPRIQAVPEVKYRWQRGFRKAQNGRYIKVPILKVILNFDKQFELLPNFLRFSVKEQSKIVRLSQNESSCELQLSEDTDYEVEVATTEEGEWLLVPKLKIDIDRLSDQLLGEWQLAKAVI